MKGMAKGLPSFLIIFIMISGCLDDSITPESNEIEIQEDFWDSYSVVAPVDTELIHTMTIFKKIKACLSLS